MNDSSYPLRSPDAELEVLALDHAKFRNALGTLSSIVELSSADLRLLYFLGVLNAEKSTTIVFVHSIDTEAI